MADAPKTRYFTSDRPVFHGGLHYAPGKVIPVKAELCNGRKLEKGLGAPCPTCGRADSKNVITQLDKPSEHFAECNRHGGPLGTEAVPPPKLVEPVVKPQTMSEVGKHEHQKGKRPSDRDI